MRMNLEGMYNMQPSSGGIKVGSRKVLKIVKIGNFLGRVKQKCGTTRLIVLDDVHFVLDMYCDLFSITAEMDAGFHLSGSKETSLTLQRDSTTIIFDQNLRSGGGKLVGVTIKQITANNKIRPSLNINKAHSILGHAGEETV